MTGTPEGAKEAGRELATAAERLAVIRVEADFLSREIGTIGVEPELREAVTARAGALHREVQDAADGLEAIRAALGAGGAPGPRDASREGVTRNARLVREGLLEEVRKLDALVRRLWKAEGASRHGPVGLAATLVTECATRILNAYGDLSDALARLETLAGGPAPGDPDPE